jgi:hypothetical protein
MVLVVLLGSYNINVFPKHAQKFKCTQRHACHLNPNVKELICGLVQVLFLSLLVNL